MTAYLGGTAFFLPPRFFLHILFLFLVLVVLFVTLLDGTASGRLPSPPLFLRYATPAGTGHHFGSGLLP